MIREIKFRAWDKENRRMTPPFNLQEFQDAPRTVKFIVNDKHFEQTDTSTNKNLVLVKDGKIDVEIMQYTGLKDKNGKEIYEGDIVKNEFLSVNKVVFSDGGFKMTSGTSVGNYLAHFVENIEIIGNIYENPNLLK